MVSILATLHASGLLAGHDHHGGVAVDLQLVLGGMRSGSSLLDLALTTLLGSLTPGGLVLSRLAATRSTDLVCLDRLPLSCPFVDLRCFQRRLLRCRPRPPPVAVPGAPPSRLS